MNAATPLDSSAIYVSLTSPLSLDKISAPLDSGSTHCFVDTDFVHKFSVPTFSVPPICWTYMSLFVLLAYVVSVCT